MLQKYNIDDILGSIKKYGGLELTQAKKNLSLYKGTKLPEFWEVAKKNGNDSLKHLTLFSIIFSHEILIKAMIDSRPFYGEGLFRRNSVDGKVFTNLQSTFRGLDYIKEEKGDSFTYDFSFIFTVENLNNIIKLMLLSKLEFAGMKDRSEFADTLIKFGFNLVFGLDESEFIEWLFDEDIKFSHIEQIFDRLGDSDNISFESGHINRNESSKRITLKNKEIKKTFLHNKIQNELFKYLSEKYGNENVGTEQSLGRNRIDLVLKRNDKFIYYEIKTSSSDISSIRQALPQLMEYAYFPNKRRANKLIIVSPAELSIKSKLYIKKLREEFNIPIFYQYYDEKNNLLMKEI